MADLAPPKSLAGYLDRSGDFDNIATPWVTLGGYVAPPSTWRWLAPVWQAVLEEDPGRTELHMREDSNQTTLLNNLNNRCLQPARERGLFVVACSIETSVFKKAQEDNPQVPDFPEVCAGVIANAAIDRMLPEARRSRRQVDLCFDQNEEFYEPLLRAWEKDRESKSRRAWATFLSEPREADSKVERGLQDKCGLETADYLVWHINRYMTKKKEAKRASNSGRRDTGVEWKSFTAKLRVVSVAGNISLLTYDLLMREFPRSNS